MPRVGSDMGLLGTVMSKPEGDRLHGKGREV